MSREDNKPLSKEHCYLEQDGASGDAQLDTVLWSVVPGQQLQVLNGAVGQRCLHVAGGLKEQREGHECMWDSPRPT